MATLRERVRAAVAANEPTDREAEREVATILARARARPTALRWPQLAIPVAAAAAGLFYLVSRSPVPDAPSGIRLYVHVTGEPESQALSLDLDSHQGQ